MKQKVFDAVLVGVIVRLVSLQKKRTYRITRGLEGRAFIFFFLDWEVRASRDETESSSDKVYSCFSGTKISSPPNRELERTTIRNIL